MPSPAAPLLGLDSSDITIRHWRERADATRRLAKDTSHPEAHRSLLNVAAEYERLADLLERVARRSAAGGPRLN